MPREARLRIRLARRHVSDLRERPRFAKKPASAARFEHPWAEYERAWIAYPGQEEWTLGKRHNLALMAAAVEGVVIAPGETFSVWRLTGSPTASRGYLAGAALKNGELVSDIGGGTCLFSTLVYNLALLSGMEIVERHAHSQDTYGDARYFELGRDAAIEYGYLDLRFRNPHTVPLAIRFSVRETAVSGTILGPSPCPFLVEIEHDEPAVLPPPTMLIADASLAPGEEMVVAPGLPGLAIHSRRRFVFENGDVRTEPLPETVHRPLPRIMRRNPG